MGELVWSKRDTHCVRCGKPVAQQPERDRHAELECDEPSCWCEAFCWETCEDPTSGHLEWLRATIEAQAAVITRFRDGWLSAVRADDSRAWRKDSYYPAKWEQMTEPEQVVLYGRVVREKTSDG